MRAFFDEDIRPVAADETHPVDILEPEFPESVRSPHDPLTVVERIGSTFTRGNPFIVQVAWSFLLNQQSRSIRSCAARLGCTPQAISRQVTRLAIRYGYPMPNKMRRQIQREAATKSWAERKRRKDRNPPAASDDQSKTNPPATPDKGPLVNVGGVNDLSD